MSSSKTGSPITQLTADFERVRLSSDPASPSKPKTGLSRWLQRLKKDHVRSNSADIGKHKTLPPLPPQPTVPPQRPGTPLASSSYRPVVSTSVPNLSANGGPTVTKPGNPYQAQKYPYDVSDVPPAHTANGAPQHGVDAARDTRRNPATHSAPLLNHVPQRSSYQVTPSSAKHSMTYELASGALHTHEPRPYVTNTPPTSARPYHSRASSGSNVSLSVTPVYPFSSTNSFPSFPVPNTPSPQPRPPAHAEPLYVAMSAPSRQALDASSDLRHMSTSAPPDIVSSAQAPLIPSPGIYITPRTIPNGPATRPSPKSGPTVSPARRPRVTSSPESPAVRSTASPSGLSTPVTAVQCAGITKAQTRCTRQVKAVAPLAYLAPDIPLERFCWQHSSDVLQPTGFYTRQATPKWVEFKGYIPAYLTSETQILLRSVMESQPSISDDAGYIYAYELRTSSSSEVVQLKVGRTVNLVKRLGEWRQQCGKEVILRGFYPSESVGGPVSLMQGKVVGGDRVKYTHRLERLIHIELADISLYSTHLTAGFLNPAAIPAPASPMSTPTRPARAPKSRPLVPCDDCGKLHQEIFSFERAKAGRLKGKEWDLIVKPIIEKWGRFVQECL